jgi:hypothetical protein
MSAPDRNSDVLLTVDVPPVHRQIVITWMPHSVQAHRVVLLLWENNVMATLQPGIL